MVHLGGLQTGIRVSGSPAAFTPLSIPSLEQWWIGSFGVTGNPIVTQWLAQFGGATFTGAGDASSPIFNAAGPNGKPELVFSVLTFFGGTYDLVQPCTVALYARSTGNGQGFFGNGSREFYRSSTPEWVYLNPSGFINGGTPTNGPNCIIVVLNGASSAIYVDGILVAAGDLGTDGMTNFLIGLSDGGTHLVGGISEFLNCNSALDLATISKLNNYFQQSYNP